MVYAGLLLWEQFKHKMAEITVKALLFALIYYPLYFFGWVTLSAADLRYWILTAFLVITGSIKFYRWMRRDDQRYTQIEQAIREKEIELEERRLAIENKKKTSL